jgi:hypothetical protein
MKTITLTTCNDVVEANLIVGRLKNEGVYAFTTNENNTTIMPHYNNMFGAGVQIVVSQQDLQKAKEVIESDTNKKYYVQNADLTILNLVWDVMYLKHYYL